MEDLWLPLKGKSNLKNKRGQKAQHCIMFTVSSDKQHEAFS
jgi:hypothetical protein